MIKRKPLSEETKRKIGLANSVALLGNIPWIKGKKHSPESIEKMRQSHKGAKAWNKGKKFSLESRKKMSESQKKNPNRYWLGKHHSPEHRAKIDGHNSHFWKGGVTPINKRIKESQRYKNWRKAVYERDNYTCQNCGQRGGRLNPHHIKAFAHYPELRFELNNGLTLCVKCHKKTDNYGAKARKLIIRKN